VTTAFDLHATGQLREAAEQFEARGCPFEAADALGDSDDEQDLRRSLAILHELGAAARAAQVARDLRSTGARAVPRGPRATTRAHVSGLTAREAEVAELLTAGLSNAQIAGKLVLSAKTVDHHVSSVLTKLGVASRRDVGAALAS
jgi:DNA-binding NarL/FixJ family response regulator